MTLLGYLVILVYIFFLIFGLGPVVQRLTNGESSRKVIHIMLFAVWSLIHVFFRGTIHQIIIPVFFIVMNLLSYRFGIYGSVERSENNHPGTVYFAIAVTFVMTVSYSLPEFYYPGGVAVFCLTFGDGFAALMGYNFPSRKLCHGKSLLGFIACFAASGLSVLGFSLVYNVPLHIPAILTIGALTAVAELMDKGMDNFTIVLGTFFLSWFCLGSNASAAVFSTAVSIAVFCVVCFSGAITYYGSLLALVMVFVFSQFGGSFGLCYLLGTYFTIFLISIVKRKLLHREKKSAGRGLRQILINGGLGTAFMILYGITGQDWAKVVSVIAIGGCFADSLASDIGVLSKKMPYDPLRRETVPAGISGGITALGTLSALTGALVIGFFTAAHLYAGLGLALICAGLIFGQAVLDTVMGSLIQAKYTCPVCGVLTEQQMHCGRQTTLTRGKAWMDNNMVNLLSSAIVTAAAVLIFWR